MDSVLEPPEVELHKNVLHTWCTTATIGMMFPPPYIYFTMGLRMSVLLYALIPCHAAYILPSSPVLMHIYCTCFSIHFVAIIPTTFNIGLLHLVKWVRDFFYEIRYYLKGHHYNLR